MSVLSKPSLSQLSVGGGFPTAVHSNSRALFTAMVSSSGPELEICGGSVAGSRIYLLLCKIMSRKCVMYYTKLNVTKHCEVKTLGAASCLITGHTAIEPCI